MRVLLTSAGAVVPYIRSTVYFRESHSIFPRMGAVLGWVQFWVEGQRIIC